MSYPDWRPIETAPMDGTSILVCDARYHDFIMVVAWEDDTESVGSQPGFNWITPDGPGYNAAVFTHWMPLPPEPQNE